MRTRLAAPLVLFALLGAPAAAQNLPESIPIGEGHMTVGFELKTTTHGDGPNGRTASHSLMRYVIPVPGAGWSPEAQAQVERWGDMTVKERTAFFFDNYKGGHEATNFQVDTEKYPYLDKSVSWYESMNIPHIEVRSNPFDSPREAMERMNALKADVRETIAFHTHLRFPDTVAAEKAEAMTEWMRRTSWAVWLRRADYSSKTDFVLKAMDNQPINVTELDKALKAFSAENPSPQKDIIERRGIRVSRLSQDGGNAIDIEFRGLMKDTRRIERFIGLAGKTFGEGNTGPFGYGPDHPIRSHDSNGKIKFRTFGWHGTGTWEAGELSYLGDKLVEARGELGINTSLSEAELRDAIGRMATADTEAGKKMLLPSAFMWLFMPIEYDPALPEGVQEQVAKQKKAYTRKLIKLAERVHAGEFGRPGEASYKPLSVASRTRRILYDFVNEPYADAGKDAKLFEWYETSLFKPEEITERTERYRTETGKNRAAEWAARAPTVASGEGFGPRRAAPAMRRGGQPVYWDRAELDRVFYPAREAAAARASELARAATVEADRGRFRDGASRVRAATLTLEESGDVDARYHAEGNTVRITKGFLDAIDARARELAPAARTEFRRKALSLVLGHELAHAYGVKAERMADREGLGVANRAGVAGELSEADVRRTLEAFSRSGDVTEKGLLERVRTFARYGTERGRVADLTAAARGEADRFAAYRRADGTVNWKRVTRDGVLTEGAGLAHFGLALFLKEMAVVAKTGDRARIEEFFDSLLTTDFYKQYGLFALGARAGEVAYAKYLQRYVKPRFVGSIMKTSVVLAAGLALPQIAEGTFEGKAFAISLSSLGLSSAAVKAGVEGLKWVIDLKKARNAGTLSRLGLGASRFARLGGWFYSAAELAVVLYLSDEISEHVNAYLDEREARSKLREAGEAFVAALSQVNVDPDAVEEAAEAYHAAWTDYRNFLYAPLYRDEAVFAERLERVAREAKLSEDRRTAAVERLDRYPALRRNVIGRHGSVEGYAEFMEQKDNERLERDVRLYSESYDKARTGHLAEVYDDHRRGTPFLGEVDALPWLIRGGQPGAAGDPWAGRSDFYAVRGRERLRAALADRLGDASPNRLEAYRDEAVVLGAAADALERDGLQASAERLRDLASKVERTRAMDDALAHGATGVIDTAAASSPGMIEALDRVGGQ